MADVFLSYKKEDVRHVQRVAAALEASGLTTWWDSRIVPAERWERQIRKELDISRAILVLWTPGATQSHWVQQEAETGVKKKRLVQAVMETCDIPERFKGEKTGHQFYDIVGWRPGFEHSAWDALLQKIKDQCAKKADLFSSSGRKIHVDGRHWRGGILKASEVIGGMPFGTVFSDLKQSPELVLVSPGAFLMGSPADEEGRYGDDREDPQRRIEIRYPLAAGRYAVTVGEFAEFVAATGYRSSADRPSIWDGQKWDEAVSMWGKDASVGTWQSSPMSQTPRHPVVLVSWDDAMAYCAWLTEKTGHRYRLLSESEWEYCCRAGSNGPFYFGQTINTQQANFNGDHSYGGKRGGKNRETTVAVDYLPPNDFGIYQALGNVWEWVEDEFAPYANCPIDGAAHQGTGGDFRVMRGGGWTDPPKHLRSACRGWADRTLRGYSVGFRVARDVAL